MSSERGNSSRRMSTRLRNELDMVLCKVAVQVSFKSKSETIMTDHLTIRSGCAAGRWAFHEQTRRIPSSGQVGRLFSSLGLLESYRPALMAEAVAGEDKGCGGFAFMKTLSLTSSLESMLR